MDFKDLQKKSLKELHELLSKQREALRGLKFKASAKQLKNVREIEILKKQNARVLTLINQKKQLPQEVKQVE